jgi:hypothetical protein
VTAQNRKNMENSELLKELKDISLIIKKNSTDNIEEVNIEEVNKRLEKVFEKRPELKILLDKMVEDKLREKKAL